MESEKVMEQMHKLDFTTLVQIKVIFEDSDDETPDLQKIKQEPEESDCPETKPQTTPATSEHAAQDIELTHTRIKHELRIKSETDFNRDISLETDNIKDVSLKAETDKASSVSTDIIKDISVKYVNKDVFIKTEINKDSENPKSPEPTITSKSTIKTEKSDTTRDSTTYDTDVICLDETPYIGSSDANDIVENSRKRELAEPDKPESSKRQFIEKETLETNAQDNAVTIVPVPNAANATATTKQNNGDTDVLCVYISNILSSVSKYLITILDSFQTYNRIKYKPRSVEILNKCWEWFVQIKEHYFNLSFSTVINIILPQEKNVAFINYFIEDTMKLGLKMNKPINSETQIRPLLMELITWTKKKQCSLSNASINKTTNYPNLKTQLSSAAVATPTNPTSSGIFYSSKNYTQQTKPAGKPKKNISRVKCPPPKETNLCTGPVRQENVLFTSGPPGQQISITLGSTPLQSFQTATDYTAASSQTLANSYNNNYNVNNIQKETPQTNCSPLYQFQRNNSPRESILPNYQTNQTIQQAVHQPRVTYDPQLMPNTSWQNQPSCWQSQNYVKPATGPAATSPNVNEQLNTEALRSVSRDSGLAASPLSCSSLIDIQDKDCISDKNRFALPPGPVISHITSMNPAAPLNVAGSCHVCGAMTKQMCIGCYTRYYCSNNCQRADWHIHKYSCHYRT